MTASMILYKARTSCLPLYNRKRHENGSTECKLCGAENESLQHFLLDCTTYNEERTNLALQRPYNEDKDKIMGNFMFTEPSIEENKETLFKLWRLREKKLKETNRNTSVQE